MTGNFITVITSFFPILGLNFPENLPCSPYLLFGTPWMKNVFNRVRHCSDRDKKKNISWNTWPISLKRIKRGLHQAFKELPGWIGLKKTLRDSPRGSCPLNVYTGQNPRQHVVLTEIQPNAYYDYLSQTAGVILTFFGVIYFCIFGIQTLILMNMNFVIISFVMYKLCFSWKHYV